MYHEPRHLLLIDILRSKSSNKRQHVTTNQTFSMIVGEDDINLEWLEIDLLLKKIERISNGEGLIF